ncbi:hypothetical protein ABB37_01697 [Leptomonas pyrrhocoris]|uniref:Uncharacterized protein n=1 Tax=Leptomonas pyrrhocoris TaxID=157538 RepID=A0A0N0DZM5_LEPPY|nr:hypothetical protein ABB37_01697 [Leptomonas pyrrhocoris]XP_015663821.1 hypothetical protein ABB37_01697 [Leptomonas pyrrhocoris]KPA85381.1 hypothetical protein ABB37_01697 [Leptomonas pyrrhocoris]KPA85382.1 hypothetical protein ABB37_01697 [Leptomonas pyrrhocoris]|eukprot:XP_015663820.1 hypothetical protein ABB37_01697 [Leptomonas pyrrhocoris]
MCAAPVGKWVVVRSDRLVLSIDKADHLYTIGRSRQLPSSQALSHRYASRAQLTVVWHPPHLYVAQTGKNPSFLGPVCESVPRASKETDAVVPEEDASAAALALPRHAQLRFSPSTTVKEAVLHKAKGGSLEVEVPPSDPLEVTHAPDRHTITASTLYFPDEVGLPSLTIRFESAEVVRADATAAATTKTAAEMLAVPTFRHVEGDDDEVLSDEEAQSEKPTISAAAAGSNGGGATNGTGGERPEWRGLLDVALQEQQRQDATRASQGPTDEKSTAVQRPPSQPVAAAARTAPPAPSASIPFGNTSSSKSAAAPPPTPQQHNIGFWEWKQHANGKDDDPKSWRKYNRAVAELLERAYRDPSLAKMKIPDSAMFDKPGQKGATYGVCFAERALDGAMIQYSLEDPGHFRLIRRTGGLPVDRQKAKRAHVIPSSSDSDSESASESEESVSDSDSDSGSEESLSSSSSSDGDEKPRKKKRRH